VEYANEVVGERCLRTPAAIRAGGCAAGCSAARVRSSPARTKPMGYSARGALMTGIQNVPFAAGVPLVEFKKPPTMISLTPLSGVRSVTR